MRYLLWILIAISMLPVAARSQALPDNPEPAKPDVSGWNRVADLDRDKPISVSRTGGHTFRCHFDEATGDSLLCYSSSPWRSDRSFKFDRSQIKTVRLDQSRRNFMITTGATAAASGIFIGLHAARHGNAITGVFGGAIGSSIGFAAGGIVAIPVAFLIPGKLIYRQPSPGWDAHSSTTPVASQSNSDPASAKDPTTNSNAH